MQAQSPHERFLNAKTFCVAGASSNRSKYGNRVFVALLKHKSIVYPLNPKADTIENHKAYPRISDLPEVPESISIITPPESTRTIVEEAIRAGVKNVWMQPGAEDAVASKAAREAGMNAIDDGSCILVFLARHWTAVSG